MTSARMLKLRRKQQSQAVKGIHPRTYSMDLIRPCFSIGDRVALKNGETDTIVHKTPWGDYELENHRGCFSPRALKPAPS